MRTPVQLVLAAVLSMGLTQLAQADPPTNDECSTATHIQSGVVAFDLTEATTGIEGQVVPCDGPDMSGISNDVWFCWTADCTGTLAVSTCGLTDIDTKIAVYDGCACGSLMLLSCNDDSCGLQSYVTSPVVAGSNYLIEIGVFPGSRPGAGNLSTTCGVSGSSCTENDRCPFGAILEDEQCGSSTDGGCNDPPNEPVKHIDCGDVICGTFWWDGRTRDTDWYEFHISSASLVTWNVFADVPVDSFILDSGCAPKVLATGSGDCPNTATATCLPAGTYRVFVAPSFSDPPILCFSPQSNYVATLTCEPCPPASSGCCKDDHSTFVDPICAAQICQLYPFCCNGECDSMCEQLAAATCGLCEHCDPPPPGMVSWWTFDDVPVSSTVLDVAGGHNGTLIGGPVSVEGKSNSALKFNGVNQHVVVTSPGTYDFGQGPYSMDAWIKWDGTHAGTIVATTGTGQPYYVLTDWYVAANGALGIALDDSCVRTCQESAAGVVTPNVWTHVTLVVSGCTCLPNCCSSNPARVFKFYVCGSLVHTYAAPGNFCLISDGGTLFIGTHDWGCGGDFPGVIDEVEIFKRELLVSEIQAICQADSYGKCKQHCHLNWDSPYCLNTNTLTTTAWICNTSSAPESYLLQFQGKSSVDGEICNGPLLNASNFSFGANQVTVAAGQCLQIPVQITRPPGLLPGQASCYTLTVTNLQNNQACQCHGSVVRTNKWCWNIENCCSMPCCTPITATFDVANSDDLDNNFSYTMTVMGPDMKPDTQYVRLNGLPPGTPVKGTLDLSIGGSTTVPVQIEFTEHVPFEFFDLLISGDENDDGDDSEVVLSTGLQSVPTPEAPLCLADIAPPAGDGTVNVADLLQIINSWGPCPPPCHADIAPRGGDGQVNVADLLGVINAWGPCQ